MDNKKVLFLVNKNVDFLEQLTRSLISEGFEVITPSGPYTRELIDEYLVKEKDFGFSIVDVRLKMNTSDNEINELFILIKLLLSNDIPVIIISKSEDFRISPFLQEVTDTLPTQSRKVLIIMIDEDYQQRLFAGYSLPINEWVSSLAGDSTTDAPPPEGKEKRKKKGD